MYAPKDGPNTLTDDQIQRLREELGQLYQGQRHAGRPMILEGGLDWREMSLSPKDMDWLAGRNNAARDIAQAFGVPAQLIGIPDSQTYSNMAEARLAFYEETVLPLVTRVIAGVDHWLTPMFDDRLQLDFDPDSISALTPRRDAMWSKLQNANFLTRNEKREAAGYGPVPGGDTIGDDEDGGGDDDPDPDPAFFFNAANDVRMEEAEVEWLKPKFNPWHDSLGRFTSGPGGDAGDGPGDDSAPAPMGDKPQGGGHGVFGIQPHPSTTMPISDSASRTPKGFILNNKIQNDMADQGWTPQQIDDAVENGSRIDAINKLTGSSATRYVNPNTGNSVVIDNATDQVIQVGGDGFKFGAGSGDVLEAIMRPAPTANLPGDAPAGGGGGFGFGRPEDIFHPRIPGREEE